MYGKRDKETLVGPQAFPILPIRSNNNEFSFSLDLNSDYDIDPGNYGGDKNPVNPIEFTNYSQNSELSPTFEYPLSQESITKFSENEFSITPIFNLSELSYIKS